MSNTVEIVSAGAPMINAIGRVGIDEGLRYMQAQRDALVPEIEKIDAYIEECDHQANKGTVRGEPQR